MYPPDYSSGDEIEYCDCTYGYTCADHEKEKRDREEYDRQWDIEQAKRDKQSFVVFIDPYDKLHFGPETDYDWS